MWLPRNSQLSFVEVVVTICNFINSFSVIESNKTIIENVKKNVQRLAQPLKKPHLYPQFVVVGMIEFASNAEMNEAVSLYSS